MEELTNDLVARLTDGNEEKVQEIKEGINTQLTEWGAPFSLIAATSDHRPLARLLACAVILSE